MNKENVNINDKVIGYNNPCYIIAEAGSNHNGDFENAKKLIDVAVEAGADAVKFQIFKAEKLYSKKTPDFDYLEDKNTFDLIKDIETPRDWIEDLADYCEKKGIDFLASPFDYEAIDLLEPYVPAYKIASFEIVDLELIKYAAEKGKPMIISTGMANLCEIEDAVNAVKSTGNDDIILLHCNSVYPTPTDIVNLRAMDTMKEAFKYPVGFSDHTLGIHIPVAAVARGASVIEKHFTLDREMEGPDHSFAQEPDDLKRMIENIRDVEEALGDGLKTPSEKEKEENYQKGRRSVHAGEEIPKGKTISREMLIVKRPGYGIKPKHIDKIIGKKAKKDIEKDDWINWEYV